MADDPHPQVQAVLEQLDAQGPPAPPTHAVRPEVARENLRAMLVEEEPEPVGSVQDTRIEGPGGPLPLRIYHPEGEGPFPIVVFLHGGGWVIGDLDTHDNVCRALTNRVGAVVIAVDYRLAPEHPFPAALEDANAAVEWAAEHGDTIGGDPDRLAVAGDSAGGNLSAAVSLYARDHGGPELAHQALIYPAVSVPTIREYESYEENGEGYVLEYETIRWFYDQYLPEGVQRRNVYAAPIEARDLSGLPPATVVTGGFDPLRDEGTEYAQRLSEAGVDTVHENYEGMIHVFVSLMDVIDRADDALDLIADRLGSSFEG